MAVFVVSAPLRRGKTFTTTEWALKRMERYDAKRRKDPTFLGWVFSNYPIKHPTLGYTKYCDLELIKTPVFDSLIIFDEAHRYFNSREYKNFTKDMHNFFAWAGQNGNDVCLITHHPARIDTIIRELSETFFYVKKFAIPLIDYPLWFTIEGYETEEDYKKTELRCSVERVRFTKRVAQSYDTHYFRNQPEELPTYESWLDKMDLKQLPEPEKKKKKSLSSNIDVKDFRWTFTTLKGLRSLGATFLAAALISRYRILERISPKRFSPDPFGWLPGIVAAMKCGPKYESKHPSLDTGLLE